MTRKTIGDTKTPKNENEPMQGIVVSLRAICPVCSGTQRIRHPLWDKFWKWKEWQSRTVAELQVFMQDNGHPTVPAEAIECPGCGGKGYKETIVLLSEVNKEI